MLGSGRIPCRGPARFAFASKPAPCADGFARHRRRIATCPLSIVPGTKNCRIVESLGPGPVL